jgi:glutathione reductase (NADPH)
LGFQQVLNYPSCLGHLLGSEADEVINLFALAIRSGMRATDLKHMLFAYPTSGSNMAHIL